MKNKRRDFIKLSGLAGLTIAGSSVVPGFAKEAYHQKRSDINSLFSTPNAPIPFRGE